MINILDRIDRVQAKFFGPQRDAEIFKAWRDEAAAALLIQDLGKHDAIKFILKNIDKEIAEMNQVLQFQKADKLSDRQRDNLIDRRDMYEWFAGHFRTAKGTLKRVEDQVIQTEKLNS